MPELPGLSQVYERVAKLKGAVIHGEMVRPSSVPMEFKIAPGGRFYARYPTSEMYIFRSEQVTWLPDKRKFSRTQREAGNPLPAGFESLWPGGPNLLPYGQSKSAMFMGKRALEIPCKASLGHKVLLYVHPESLLPLGSIAIAGGTEYEMRYLWVEERVVTDRELTFVAPTDAKPLSSPPDISRLIKIGSPLPAFQGSDFNGHPLGSAAISRQFRGYLLNFWFSACTGCVQEMPVLTKLSKSLQGQKIGVLGVNPIDQNKDARRTSTFQKLNYPTLMGASAKKLADSLGIVTYPVTVVVDRQGKVVDAILGFDEKRLRKALKAIGYRS